MGKPDSLSIPVTTMVAVVGAGAMGAGIAQVAAMAGHRVRLVDSRSGAAEAAVSKIRATLSELASKKKIDAQQAADASARISAAESSGEIGDAGLVIEAIVEDLDAKRKLLSQLADVVSEQCILATNTSSISVTAIAAKVKAPERVVGMHFFNPAPQMALVEIVAGLATSDKVMQCLTATAAAWGKVPVQTKSTPGFIVNRCARPFYAEGLRLLLEQAGDCATIDAVMRESGGFRMGPFELMDLIGHDVNYAVTKSVFDANYGDPRYTPSLIQLELVHAGFLGRKTGRGFYDYKSDRPVQPLTEASTTMRPTRMTVYGECGLAKAILRGVQGVAGLQADIQPEDVDGIVAQMADVVVALTDGRTATQRALDLDEENLVLVDLALDYETAKRVAVAKADSCSEAAFSQVVALLQAAGFAVSRLQDVPGMAVMRTVAMLANEAAEAVNHGVCSPESADLAMVKGVNYPRGPLAWADDIGPAFISRVLQNLSSGYGEDRYRVSTLLRRRAASGNKLTGAHA